MAKVIGPLQSLDARGQFAETLIYAKQRGTNYTKAYAVPTNPQSAPQTLQRLGIAAITKAWSTLHADEKLTWQPLADNWFLSQYHAFLRYNAIRWRNELPPCPRFPDYSNAIHFVPVLTWTNVGLLWTCYHKVEFPTQEPFAIQVVVGTFPSFPPTKSGTRIIEARYQYIGLDKWDITVEWTAPDPTTYFCWARYAGRRGGTSMWEEPP